MDWIRNVIRGGGRRSGRSASGTYASMILDSAYTVPIAKNSADWAEYYGKHPWLHAVVTRIAEGVAACPWNIYQEESGINGRGKTLTERKSVGTHAGRAARLVPQHPAIRLLQRPNPEHTGYTLRILTQIYLETTGEAYWLIERDQNGTPCMLLPIPPAWVDELPDTKDPNFIIKLRGKPVRVPRQDVVWFRKPNPFDPYGRGIGDAQAVADEIAADEYASKTAMRFFYNGARPDIMMILKGKLRSKEEAKRIKENWYTEHGGLWNSYKMALVEGDVADIKTLTTTPKDMEFTGLRQNSRNTIIGGGWGMPPSMIGIVEDVNRANAESGEYVFGKWIVYPRLIQFQDTVTSDLLSQFPEYPGCWLEHADPVPENRGARSMEMLQAFQSNAVTWNEYREYLGQRKDANGDVYRYDPRQAVSRFPGGPSNPGAAARPTPGPPAPPPGNPPSSGAKPKPSPPLDVDTLLNHQPGDNPTNGPPLSTMDGGQPGVPPPPKNPPPPLNGRSTNGTPPCLEDQVNKILEG